jgi:hypothetical protein
VGYIDVLGTKNVWTTKIRSNTETSAAMRMTTTHPTAQW